ncbi:MFS transporter [Geodermatophilus sp. URMC 64]
MAGTVRLRRPYYGWAVVAALGVVLAVTVGISFYGVSVYLEALTRGPRAFSLATVSVATSAFLLVGGVAGVGVAALLDRADVRWVLCAGAVLAGAALWALGSVRTPGQLVLAYAALGVGFAATGTIPASALIARWFTRRRAVAMSLAFTGLPLGGAVLTPPIAALVQSLGVAGAAPWLAGAYVVGVVPVTLAFVRPGPESRGAWPDGDPAPPPPLTDGGEGVGQALRTGWFWVATAALTLGMLGQVGTLSHLFNAVTERIDAVVAAAAVSVMALASLAGRVLGSAVLGRVRLTVTTAVLLGLQCVATLGIGAAPSTAAVVICTATFGLTIGNMQVLHPLLVAERFGARSFGRILALSNLGVSGGMAFGPLVVGAVRTGSGSYQWAMAAAACSAAAGSVLLVLLLTAARRTRPAGAPEPSVLDVNVR